MCSSKLLPLFVRVFHPFRHVAFSNQTVHKKKFSEGAEGRVGRRCEGAEGRARRVFKALAGEGDALSLDRSAAQGR